VEVKRIIESYLWLGYYADEHYDIQGVLGPIPYYPSSLFNLLITPPQDDPLWIPVLPEFPVPVPIPVY